MYFKKYIDEYKDEWGNASSDKKLFLLNFVFDKIYITIVFVMLLFYSWINRFDLRSSFILAGIFAGLSCFFIYNRVDNYSDKKILSYNKRLVGSVFLIGIRLMYVYIAITNLSSYFGIYTFSVFYYFMGGTLLHVFNNKSEYYNFLIFIFGIFLLKSINLTNLGLLLTVLSVCVSVLDKKSLEEIYKGKNNEFSDEFFLSDKISYAFCIVIFYVSMLLSESNKAFFAEFLKNIDINGNTMYFWIKYLLDDFANPVYKSIVFGLVFLITRDLFDWIKKFLFTRRYRKYRHKKIYTKNGEIKARRKKSL